MWEAVRAPQGGPEDASRSSWAARAAGCPTAWCAVLIDKWVAGAAIAAGRPPAHPAPHLRHPSAGERRRPAGDPGAARPQLAVDDPEIHPPGGRAAARGLPRRPSRARRESGETQNDRAARHPRFERFECSPGGVILRGRRRLRTLLVGLTLLMLAVAAATWIAGRLWPGRPRPAGGRHPVDGAGG